jgi:bifunctional non-homologous end joining protein LigD
MESSGTRGKWAPASTRRRCAISVRGCASAGATWAEPELVAQVGFSEWTRAGRLRHPRFLGLREDKSAREVVREG